MTFAKEIREDLSEELTFEQEPEGGEGADHQEKRGNRAPDRGNSKCKGPEAETH